MEKILRQELLGKRIMSPTLLITKAKGCSKNNRGRNIWGLNKTECEYNREQAGFANMVSVGALLRAIIQRKGTRGLSGSRGHWSPLVSVAAF